MLKGEPDFAAEDEAASPFESGGGALGEPLPVVYNAAYPPEYFDVIVFPGRTEVPKTLVFAKDDSHAEDAGPLGMTIDVLVPLG